MTTSLVIILAILPQYASALQTNAANIRQREENHHRQMCDTFSETSTVAKEICAVLLEEKAAADFQAYRDLLVDKNAFQDFQHFTQLRANAVLKEHMHKLLTDPKLLDKFVQFQQFQEWQESKVVESPSAQTVFQKASSAAFEGKQEESVPSSLLLVVIPAVLLIVFCGIVGCGAACRNLVSACFSGLQLAYMMVMGPDSIDDDKPPKKEGSEEDIEEQGIAKPVKTLWYTEWEDLTPGQKWVFSYIGVTNNKLWDIARKTDGITKEEHDIRNTTLHLDWSKLSRRQQGKLSYLGFTQASFQEDCVLPMSIHEKRWEDLTSMEKKLAGKILGVDPKAKDAEEWDQREGEIFHTKYKLLPKATRQELVKLGFGLRHWKPYVDPEVPVHKELSTCEYCMDKCGKALVGLIGLFLVFWICFCIHETGVLHNILANFGTYGCEGALIIAVVLLIVYELWEVASYVTEAMLHQFSTLLTHIRDVWDMVNESIERVEEKLNQLDVKTKVKTATEKCAPTSWAPRRTQSAQ